MLKNRPSGAFVKWSISFYLLYNLSLGLGWGRWRWRWGWDWAAVAVAAVAVAAVAVAAAMAHLNDPLKCWMLNVPSRYWHFSWRDDSAHFFDEWISSCSDDDVSFSWQCLVCDVITQHKFISIIFSWLTSY